jgi:hypothetical protein
MPIHGVLSNQSCGPNTSHLPTTDHKNFAAWRFGHRKVVVSPATLTTVATSGSNLSLWTKHLQGRTFNSPCQTFQVLLLRAPPAAAPTYRRNSGFLPISGCLRRRKMQTESHPCHRLHVSNPDLHGDRIRKCMTYLARLFGFIYCGQLPRLHLNIAEIQAFGRNSGFWLERKMQIESHPYHRLHVSTPHLHADWMDV